MTATHEAIGERLTMAENQGLSLKTCRVGEIRGDQMVWESSVAVGLWVVGGGSTMRRETREQKQGNSNLRGVY